MGKNISQSLIPTLKAEFLMQDRALPHDVSNYDWHFSSREDTEEIDKGDKNRKRMPCPYSQDRKLAHRKASDKADPGFQSAKMCLLRE